MEIKFDSFGEFIKTVVQASAVGAGFAICVAPKVAETTPRLFNVIKANPGKTTLLLATTPIVAPKLAQQIYKIGKASIQTAAKTSYSICDNACRYTYSGLVKGSQWAYKSAKKHPKATLGLASTGALGAAYYTSSPETQTKITSFIPNVIKDSSQNCKDTCVKSVKNSISQGKNSLKTTATNIATYIANAVSNQINNLYQKLI